MTWDVVVHMLMKVVETEFVEIVETEIVVIEVAIELVLGQLESALLSGIVPQWGSSGHSPLPAM